MARMDLCPKQQEENEKKKITNKNKNGHAMYIRRPVLYQLNCSFSTTQTVPPELICGRSRRLSEENISQNPVKALIKQDLDWWAN